VAKWVLATAIAVVWCAAVLPGAANEAPPSGGAVQQAMAIVETILARHDIDVRGYAQTAPPQVERVDASHQYLQGNDGGYVDGRIYLNAAVIEDCLQLTLVHELVHDVSVKHRLFAEVPNTRIRQVLEALADAVTAVAAEDPYLPGCLPERRFQVSAADLASLASPALRR
jgi:hypothetical protein